MPVMRCSVPKGLFTHLIMVPFDLNGEDWCIKSIDVFGINGHGAAVLLANRAVIGHGALMRASVIGDHTVLVVSMFRNRR